MKKRVLRAVGVSSALLLAVTVSADSLFEDFETMTLGTVHQQNGWSASGAFLDEEVADTGGGNQALRLSNAGTSGSFGDQVFTASLGTPAGEGAPLARFTGGFDFWSATGAAQTGLRITVSPDNGSGGRQSFIAIEDTGSGLDLLFADYDDSVNNFAYTYVASGLAYDAVHNLGFEILFSNGPDNDVVNIFVNGGLVHTGRTWEQYYADWQPANVPVTVDSLLFRMSGTAAPSNLGNGYFIDNVSLATTVVPVPAAAPLGLLGMGMLAWLRRRKGAKAD